MPPPIMRKSYEVFSAVSRPTICAYLANRDARTAAMASEQTARRASISSWKVDVHDIRLDYV